MDTYHTLKCFDQLNLPAYSGGATCKCIKMLYTLTRNDHTDVKLFQMKHATHVVDVDIRGGVLRGCLWSFHFFFSIHKI